MADKRTTTPPCVFKSPDTFFANHPTFAVALQAFDQCLALTQQSLQADAKMMAHGRDPALDSFGESAAADAEARAVTALEAFPGVGVRSLHLLAAAGDIRDLIADNGDGLDALAERARDLREAAWSYAAMPLQVIVAIGARLATAANLIEAMIEAASVNHPLSISEMDLA